MNSVSQRHDHATNEYYTVIEAFDEADDMAMSVVVRTPMGKSTRVSWNKHTHRCDRMFHTCCALVGACTECGSESPEGCTVCRAEAQEQKREARVERAMDAMVDRAEDRAREAASFGRREW
jgi:hypothetical protein